MPDLFLRMHFNILLCYVVEINVCEILWCKIIIQFINFNVFHGNSTEIIVPHETCKLFNIFVDTFWVWRKMRTLMKFHEGWRCDGDEGVQKLKQQKKIRKMKVVVIFSVKPQWKHKIFCLQWWHRRERAGKDIMWV